MTRILVFINTFDIRKYNFLRWIERWYLYPYCAIVITNTISYFTSALTFKELSFKIGILKSFKDFFKELFSVFGA
jgi:hypothetical protein